MSPLLTRDKRWGIFHGDISFEDFVSQKIPRVKFKAAVNIQIKDVFKIIQKLLAHSYFEYQFIDFAVIKALQSFEMALKIRYRELNEHDWKRNAPLEQLIKWFVDGNYFEFDNPDFFQHVRKTRNHLSHPSGDYFAGSSSIHWIDTTVELINDLYEDKELRNQRKIREMEFLNEFNIAFKNGAKIVFKRNEILVYACANVILNNKIKPEVYHVCLLPVFDLTSTDIKYPIFFELTKLSSLDNIRCIDERGDEALVQDLTSKNEIDVVTEFRSKIHNEVQHSMQHSSLLFDVDGYLRIVRRTNQFLDEVD